MRWFLRFRIFIIISFAVILISAAVLFSVLRAVLPFATGYKIEIQQEISRQIGLPVEIESIDAAIYWFSPRLKLIEVVVYDEQKTAPLFKLEEAFVGLDVISSIIRQEIIVGDIGLIGADISIEKLSQHEWLVQGIKFTSEGSSELPEQFIYMIQNSNYLLHDSNIYYQDHTGEKLNLRLLDVNIDVSNEFNIHDIRFSMNLPEAYGKALSVVAKLRGDFNALDGDIYIEATRLNLQQWNEKFNSARIFQLDGILDIELWGAIKNTRLESLVTELSCSNLKVSNKLDNRSWRSDHLSAKARYIEDQGHRHLAITDFAFGYSAKPAWGQAVNILASEDDKFYFVSADMLRVGDLQKLAEVFLDAEQLSSLSQTLPYRVEADVYNLNAQIPKDGNNDNLVEDLSFDFSVFDVYLSDKENSFRLAGLDGFIHYEHGQAAIEFESRDTEIEFKQLFREPIFANTIHGNMLVDVKTDYWHFSTEQLQIKNEHINTFSRFDMQIDAKNKVLIDAQTDFYDGYGKYARHYMPVGIMSPELIQWLDSAVADGYVSSGSFLLHGDLSRFPFRENDGVFQVLLSAQDLNLRFLQGWPKLSDTSASIKFSKQAMLIEHATGKTLNASLFNGRAEIPDLARPVLSVTTNAHGSNEDLLAYVWNSPLNEIFGNALRLFQLTGESDLSLKLDIPLNKSKTDIAVDGHLNLLNSSLYYPLLGYKLNAINGILDFTQDSLFADTVKAKIQNHPVILNVATRKDDSGDVLAFNLDGVIAADYLLQAYQWIPDHWISGQSDWSIEITAPIKIEDSLLHIKASSLLEDVVVQMSDSVSKPRNQKLALTADIDVLNNNGLRIKTRAIDVLETQNTSEKTNKEEQESKPVLDLSAVRNENEIWIFDIESAFISGHGELAQGLGHDTEINLALDNIDVSALFFSKEHKASQSLKPADFPSLNWKARQAIWQDMVLSDVVVETSWNKHGMLIDKFSLQAPAMSFNSMGTWLTSWRGTQETVLQGTLSGTNIGDSLTGLGFHRSIDRAKYNASFSAKWPAAPYELSWANMKGKTTFEMNKGEMLNVEPGTGGRLLGLLNIFRLANRLVFDFDDVYRDGYSFDSVNGEFEFVEGDGSLKNVNVSAAAADVSMFGSIGLEKRDYGLLMRVKPHTDSITFAGGALLGGVVVGAGLALLQKVFDLGVIGHDVYSITGSWDDPVIEKIVEKTTNTTSGTAEDDF